MNEYAAERDFQFNRLVDGELNDEEYQRLIESLDLQPDGWRQCALAFLESQALGGELRAIGAEMVPDEAANARRPKGGQAKRSSNSNPRPSFMALWLASALSFVVALGMGVAVRSFWSPRTPQIQTTTVQDPSITQPNSPLAVGDRTNAASMAVADAVPGASQSSETRRPLGHVRMIVDGRDATRGQPVEVPFYDLDQFDPLWLVDDASPVPPEIVSIINRMGRELRHNQQLVPIRVQGGRQVVIPVEEFEIMPARVNRFQ